MDSWSIDSAFSELPAPPLDWALSPITGLTRAHWATYADDLLLAAARYQSPQGARFDLAGVPSQQGMRTDGLEGFARTFLLAAFRHVGSAPGDGDGHLARYLGGLVAGTRNPGQEDHESWPIIGGVGRHGQPMVEAASVALAMHLTKAHSWNQLDGGEKDRLEGWLREALRHEPSANNWYLFPTTVASFLEGVGRGDHETISAIERGLHLLDGWYRGEGWYSDGDAQAFDHYVGWAMHLYPMLHAMLRGDDPLLQRLGDRLTLFLESFAVTFDRNGAPLYYGRSMTYRTATLASVALGAVSGHTPLGPGESRRLLSAGLRYFLRPGVREDGVFTLGWLNHHPPTVQSYSGPGSPYWASKGFLGLVLPEGHELWTATEEESESERSDVVRPVAPAGLLVQRTASDGLVRVHNHGNDHVKPQEADNGGPDPLYGRFAYGTRTGPTALHNPSDNDLQVEFEGVWSVRRRIHMAGHGANWIASWHAPRFPETAPFLASPYLPSGPVLPSARIESVVAVFGRLEVRIHRLVNIPLGSSVRSSGWAIAAERPEHVSSSTRDGTIEATDGSGLKSHLSGVAGWTEARISIASAGTAFGRWAVVPELRGVSRKDQTFVSLASLTADAHPETMSKLVEVTVEGALIDIIWAPAGTRTTIDLDSLDWGRPAPSRPRNDVSRGPGSR